MILNIRFAEIVIIFKDKEVILEFGNFVASGRLKYLYPIIISVLILWNCDNPVKINDFNEDEAAYAFPAWSPDGEWIAIRWIGDPAIVPWNLCLIRPDGSDLRKFPNSENFGRIVDINWSPDSEWLAFTTLGWNVYKVKANGDSLTQLTFTGDSPSCSWSYSDSIIAYYRMHSNNDSTGIWIMNKYGQNKSLISRHASHFDFSLGDSLFYEISIGPDSAKMVFFFIPDSTERIIYKWKRHDPYITYYYPDVSPDGKTIAFAIDDYIRTISANGDNIKTLTAHRGVYPCWSPNGQQIVYCAYSSDPYGGVIRIMNADGSNNRILTDCSELAYPDSL
ncbi:MAG: hypothetical protein DRP46_09610 [Candidatus Zixiibacteriota bacterium]|nr:MAG: hypothetical protein DRP46_09610 [candidate division Zixibacteria bacterium]